jgi:hypothetical protein
VRQNKSTCLAFAIVWSGVLEWSVGVESGVQFGVRFWSDLGVENWSEILELNFGVTLKYCLST